MIPNSNLTQEEALWLLNEYAPKRGGRVSGETMDKYFTKARGLIMGKPVERPGCGCQYKSYVMMTNSLFSQHYEAIKKIATPKPKSRGRSKKV